MPVQFYLFTRPDKQGDHPINVSISLFGERIADRMNEDYAFIMYSNHPSYR